MKCIYARLDIDIVSDMPVGFADALIEFSGQIMSRLSRLSLGLHAHDSCCDQMRYTERLMDVVVGRSELHDFDSIGGLDS
jgi:hypothetical protein